MISAYARTALKQGLWIPVLWLGFALFDATQTVAAMRSEGMHHYWIRLFFVVTLSWLPWAAGSILIVWLGRRLPLFGPRRLPAWSAHIATAVLIALSSAAWAALLYATLNPYADAQAPSFFPHWQDDLYNNLLSTAVLYAVVLMIQGAIDAQERLARAQLTALRHQIEPHFLFNALNAIAGFVREGRSDAAVDTIVALSDFLRRTLSGSDAQEVPLADEMEFVRQYLAIQQARFADRLRVDIDVPDDLLRAQVPNLIVQPLVENAVIHGIAKRAQAGAIAVAASKTENALTITVSNEGPPLPDGWDANKTGIGISNVRERLQSLYGGRASFAIRNKATGGVEASIRMPLRVAREKAGVV